MNEENVAFRLKGFIDYSGLTHSQFADRCAIPRPSLSQIISGRNKKVSDVIVGQIHQAFPDLSILWLLFGEGPMLSPTPNGDNRSNGASIGESAVSKASSPDVIVNNASLFSQNPPDNSNIPSGRAASSNYSNVKPLNTPGFNSQNTNQQVNTSDNKTAELLREIDKMRKNPRKVSHITIYYDDSTFETFYPRR